MAALDSGSKTGYVVSTDFPYSGPKPAAYAASNTQSLTSQRRTGPYVRYQQISAPKTPAFVPGRVISLPRSNTGALRQRSARIVQVGGLPNVATI